VTFLPPRAGEHGPRFALRETCEPRQQTIFARKASKWLQAVGSVALRSDTRALVGRVRSNTLDRDPMPAVVRF